MIHYSSRDLYIIPRCIGAEAEQKTKCHVHAGISVELQLPEYSVIYKRGRQGLQPSQTISLSPDYWLHSSRLYYTCSLYKHHQCTLTLWCICSVLFFTSLYQAFDLWLLFWFLLLHHAVYAVCLFPDLTFACTLTLFFGDFFLLIALIIEDLSTCTCIQCLHSWH